MITNDGGYSAYANEASQINNNLQRYRSDIDNVASANKQIKQQFQAKADLDNLRNLGAELGAKGVKDIGAKILGKVYRLKGYGGRSIRDFDVDNSFETDDVPQTIVDAVRKGSKGLKNIASQQADKFGEFLDRQKALNDERNALAKTDNFVKERTGGGVEDAIGKGGNRSVFDSVDLDEEPSSSVATRVENPDAEPSRPTPMENESNEIKPEVSEATTEVKATELPEGVNTLDEGAKGALDVANTSVGDSVSSAGTSSGTALTDATSDVAKDAGTDIAKDAGTDLVEEGAETAGLEGAGALLDSTGVGAIIGVPLQIAGLVADGGLLYEAGKSLVDWFDEDILGHKPQVPKNQLVATPTRPLTLADRGLAVVPNIDTIDTQPSYAGGW